MIDGHAPGEDKLALHLLLSAKGAQPLGTSDGRSRSSCMYSKHYHGALRGSTGNRESSRVDAMGSFGVKLLACSWPIKHFETLKSEAHISLCTPWKQLLMYPLASHGGHEMVSTPGAMYIGGDGDGDDALNQR